jgi:hypothetical protein
MAEKLFSDYNLVGGTALALQIGHRNSIDIDLFGVCEIQTDVFTQELSKLGSLTIVQNSKNILITQINNVKVDFVNYKYPLLEKPMIYEGIRLLSRMDIAAMKINAVAGRGSKKDFIDLYFLMKEFTLTDMLSFYQRKYSDGSIFMAQKSLTYFEDADMQPQPKMFMDFDWDLCKQTFLEEVKKL